jgi:hypothetical protein
MKFLTKVILCTTLILTVVGCTEKEYVSVEPNWEALNNLPASDNTFKVSAAAGKNYKLGEGLKFSATSDKEGKLWIVQVDSSDYVSQLYPNSNEPDNTIKANKLVKVPAVDSYTLVADKPLGLSVIAFIVTTGDTSLTDVLSTGNNMRKALVLASNSKSWGITKRVIDVTE